MAPPVSMECSFPDCQYTTPATIPTYEYVLKALELHVSAAHSTVMGVGNRRNDAPKTEKPKRPQIQANMSEGDWVFFEHKWSRYKRQSGISGQQLVDEIWACLDTDLERLAFQDGMEETEPQKLLDAIKALAVTTVHPALHVVSLHGMKQLPDETVKAFSARVKGVAKNCNLKKQCSKPDCSVRDGVVL